MAFALKARDVPEKGLPGAVRRPPRSAEALTAPLVFSPQVDRWPWAGSVPQARLPHVAVPTRTGVVCRWAARALMAFADSSPVKLIKDSLQSTVPGILATYSGHLFLHTSKKS